MFGPYRLTILLALLLCGLGAYVYFVDVPASQELERKAHEDRRILPFDDRDVTHLTITIPNEKIVFVRETPRRWRIMEPLQSPADSHEVRKVLRALTVGRIQRVIQEDTENPDQYGLTTPRMTLSLSTGKQSEVIALGNPGPISATLYARKSSDGRVLLTTLDILAFRKKSLNTFRRKRILTFDRMQVEEFRLDTEEDPLILFRRPSVHSLSPSWSFRSPIQGPADKTKVGLLLMALEGLKAVGFVDSTSEKEQILGKLGSPTLTATVQTRKLKHAVKVYQMKDRSGAYAMTAEDKPLYRIEPQAVAELSKGLFDLRDKRLLGMEARELAILKVVTAKSSYTLINQSGEWVLENDLSQTLNQQIVKLFVSRLADLPAELRISKETTALSSYGLESPSAEFFATDRKGRERGHLALGKHDRGLVYAMGSGLPGIYQARSAILTQIPSKHRLTAK